MVCGSLSLVWIVPMQWVPPVDLLGRGVIMRSLMGPNSNDRSASLWPIGWDDKGHVPVGVSEVRLGVVGHDESVSAGATQFTRHNHFLQM